MSDDMPINAPDHFTAKKRLVGDLRIYVVIQAVALFVSVWGVGIVLLDLDGAVIDGLGSVLGLSGMGVSFVMAFLACHKLWHAVFLPNSIRNYGFGIYVLALCFLFLSPVLLAPFFVLFIVLFFAHPLYGIVPQYFIARWLAKEVEDGTISHQEPRV